MKVMFASDIHGNYIEFKKVYDFFINEEIDLMVILGDSFSSSYASSVDDHEIINLLWSIADKVEICMGNCDSSYQEELLPVGFSTSIKSTVNNFHYQAYHGHFYLEVDKNTNLIASGHTHIPKIYDEKGITYLNPGSVGRPRITSYGTFAVLSNSSITIFDTNYDVIDEIMIK